MWDGVNNHSSATKEKLEDVLKDSDQFLFLRTTNSELRIRGNNNSIRQWCAWEIGNFYTKHKEEKYYTSFYDKDCFIMRKQFALKIIVAEARKIEFKVYETETNEEYVLVHVPGAEGEFVGSIRKVCEKELILSNRCFDTELIKAEQTQRIVDFIRNRYDVEP